MMIRRWLLAVAGSTAPLTILAVACGLRAGGVLDPPLPDVGDAAIDARADAPDVFEAGPSDASDASDAGDGCSPVFTADDPLQESLDPDRWSSIGPILPSSEGVALLTAGATNSLTSAIWFRLPLTFDIWEWSVEFEVRVTDLDRDTAHGFAFAWVDGVAAGPPKTVRSGSYLGLPSERRGYAVVFDTKQDPAMGDPYDTFMGLVELDPTKEPDVPYNWHLPDAATDLAYNDLIGWKRVRIAMIDTTRLTVTLGEGLNAKTLEVNDSTLQQVDGYFGITASTGSAERDGVALRNLKVRTRSYACAR